MRIKIAEACGWKPTGAHWGNGVPTFWKLGEPTKMLTELPDYLNDLNAMNEAEKMLTNEQWGTYSSKLWLITNQAPATYECHATASQRAEAFLRTLGLRKGVDHE